MRFTDKMKIDQYKIYYDILMAFFAAIILISLIVQAKVELTDNQLYVVEQIDFSIWLFFVLDYLVRLVAAKDKWYFIKHNIVDLISIIPFESFFQGFRALRLIRLLYMLRVFIYLNRAEKQLSALVKTNDLHHVLWLTFSTIFCGAIAISYVDDIDMGDALWWSFVTTTTVGYGDIAPQTLGGRLIAVILMLVGIGFLSMLTGTIATFFITTQKQHINYCDEAIGQIINKLEHFSDLTTTDINDIHSVLLTLKESHKETKEMDPQKAN